MADSKKDVMRLPAVGIKKINGGYQRVTLDTRNYNERMNLAPIPQMKLITARISTRIQDTNLNRMFT